MPNPKITLWTASLDSIIKALKEKPPSVRVGILGSNNVRADGSGVSNSEVGAAHEFGSPTRNLPQRSFLRVPLTERLDQALEKSNFFNKDSLKTAVTEGSLANWAKKIGVVAVGVVLEAFSSNGFGKWAPWRSKNYKNKTGDILVDTTNLRNSITSEVKK